MGSRAAHNFKRRQKLILKHTGKEYDPHRRKKGHGKGKDTSGKSGKGGKDKRGKGKGKSKADVGKSKDRGVKKKVKPVSTGKRTVFAEDSATGEATGPATSKRKLKVKKIKDASAGEDALGGSIKKVKKIKLKLISKKTTKRDSSPTSERKKTRLEHKRAWKLARQTIRHRATVICPGSVTDRFARGGVSHAALFLPLNSFERRELGSGALSWRWLREEDEYDDLPPRPKPPEANSKEHGAALKQQMQSLGTEGAKKLQDLDTYLGEDASWPRCARRVQLAAKLQLKASSNRYCVRYFDEVLEPLLSESDLPVASSSSAPLLKEAKYLFTKCCERWLAARGEKLKTQEADKQLVRRSWLQMLRRCLTVSDPEAEEGRMQSAHPLGQLDTKWWLRALRSCFLARFCAWPDAAAQQLMLRNAALYAARGSTKAGAANTNVSVLPLGVFTPRQALLLVACARWLGGEATVVRRTAAGPAEVVFRSADVTITSDVSTANI